MVNSPKIETITYASPATSVVHMAASVLRDGGLIVAPTETRYGLLARADNHPALTHLYNVKGRPATLPTAIFVKSVSDMSRYGKMNPAAIRLAEKFLPGPLTLVIEAATDYGAPLVVDSRIGIRISTAPFIVKLLDEIDFPVTATSANLSGQGDFESVDEIARAFGGKIALYVNVGMLSGIVSTVVDVTVDPPSIIRAGAISEARILEVLKSQLI